MNSLSPNKILIINPSSIEADLMKGLFEDNGFDVILAETGSQALSIIPEEMPDIVLIDLHLDDIDGIELSLEIRKDNRATKSLIALLSDRNEDYTKIAAYQAGVDSFLIKPIRNRVLIEEVKVLLRRRTRDEESASLITLGDLKIDLDKRIVTYNGVALFLTKKEFDLIVMLSSKPKKVFTREEVYRRVWGEEITEGNRIIDVYIRKLRTKLGANTIQSVKGVGYKFIAQIHD